MKRLSPDKPLLPVKPARLRLRPMLLALLCWLGCAAAIALATRGYLDSAWRGAQAGLTIEAQAGAAALEQNLLRVFEVVTAQLDLLETRERMLAAHEGAAALGIEEHLLRSVSANRFGVTAANSIGLDGIVRFGTTPGMEGAYVGDRDTIAAQLRGESAGPGGQPPGAGPGANGPADAGACW